MNDFEKEEKERAYRAFSRVVVSASSRQMKLQHCMEEAATEDDLATSLRNYVKSHDGTIALQKDPGIYDNWEEGCNNSIWMFASQSDVFIRGYPEFASQVAWALAKELRDTGTFSKSGSRCYG